LIQQLKIQNSQQILTSEVLEHARRYIEPILAELKTHLWEDIVEGLLNKRFHLLPLKNSALICEFIQYPRLKALNIFLAGGDLEEIKALTPHLYSWAKDCGADRIEIRGRIGWLKVFKNELDYDKTFIQISRDL
jgi:hypothetical protein